MDSKKRRSSLRKSLAADTIAGDIKSAQRRRISFSGKKSVRIFNGEEEPKAWNNSFEISDNLNVNETAICAPSKINHLQSSQTISYENKENFAEMADYRQQQNNLTNLSTNNVSDQTTTNDFINTSDQITRTFRIENSIDITLMEYEKKFQKEVTCNDQTSLNLLSFSLEDNERKGQFGEKTVDFMRDLKNNSNENEEDMKVSDTSNKIEVVSHSDTVYEIPNLYSSPGKNKSLHDCITFSKNDSFSMKCDEQICSKNYVKRKSVYEVTDMQLTLNEVHQHDKENLNPLSLQNQTLNSSYQMELEDKPSNPQINEDSNRTKLRPTIYFDQSIGTSATKSMNITTKKLMENVDFENKKTLRSSIYFNRTIDVDAQTATTGGNYNNSDISKVNPSSVVFNQTFETSPNNLVPKLYRKTMNFNEDMDTTSHGILSQETVSDPITLDTKLCRRITNLNEDMDTTSHITISQDSVPYRNSLSNNFLRKTININEDMDTTSCGALSQASVPCTTGLDTNTTSGGTLSQESVPFPNSFSANLCKKTMKLSEGMDTTSHDSLSQASNSCENLNLSTSSRNIRKNQPTKIIFRKICLPTPNSEKRLFDSRQQRMLRLENQQQKGPTTDGTNSAIISVEKNEGKKVNKSLNFSVESLKNCSLSSESSSPLIPIEFKGYTLKQLNDEIENGRIKIFPNAQKTPIVNRKICNILSIFRPDNESLPQPQEQQKSSLLSEDENVEKTCNKIKYRYSQADEIMLDNTSFLARAKLSDETMSQKSSKRDSTQFNDTMDIFDETLTEAAGPFEDGATHSRLNPKTRCHPGESPTYSMDVMDISHSNEHEHEKYDPSTKFPLLERPKEWQTTYRQVTDSSCNSKTLTETTLCCSQEIEDTAVDTSGKTMRFKTKILDESLALDDKVLIRNTDVEYCNSNPCRKTIYYGEESVIGDNKLVENSNIASSNFKPYRKTSYFNTDISFNADTEKRAEPKKCVSLNPNRKTILFATNILDETGTISFSNNEVPLENENSSTDQNNVHSDRLLLNNKSPVEELLAEAERNKEMDFTDNNENTEVVSRNFNPSRKVLYYNNEISLQNPNVTTEENDQDAVSKTYLSDNPCKRTLLFETEIKEDSMLREDNSIEKADKTSRGLVSAEKSLSLRKGISSIDQNYIPSDEVVESFKINEQSDFSKTDMSLAQPIRKTIYFQTKIQDSITNDENSDVVSCSLIPSARKTFESKKQIMEVEENSLPNEETKDSNKILLENFFINTGLTETGISLSSAMRNTQLFQTKNQEDYTKNGENVSVVNTNNEPGRKTFYYNSEIPLENTVTEIPVTENSKSNACIPMKSATKKNCSQSDLNTTSPENEKCPRKTIYFNSEICGTEIPKQNAAKTNIANQEKLELMDLTVNNLEVKNNRDVYKTPSFQNKVSARRRSVYSPENMDLTLHDDVLNNKVIDEKHELNHVNEQMETESKQISLSESKDFKDVGEIDQSFQPSEFFKFPESAASMNAAKMTLSRRFAKPAFITPKKSSGSSKNFSLCITPRLSLLEFERLEKEERQECEDNCKRLAFNLTPVLSVTKKKHNICFDDCLENALESSGGNKGTEFVDDLKDKSMLFDVDTNESLLKTPLREKKSRIPIPVSSSSKMQKSCSLVEADNCSQNENDSQLGTVMIDNFGESIQLMRRATTFGNREDTISEQYASLQAPKPSIFEGNPITISDVSVFFETQRKSHINATQPETSLPLEAPNSFALQPVEEPKINLESRFMNLTLEDIDKTHLSLVRGYEDDDKDETESINDLNEEDQDIRELSLEKHTSNALETNRNVTLVCRKCKRCQETFVNETSSSISESFVLPALPAIPDLGLERLRLLRKRPSLADINVLWQRASLDRTIYNANISGNDTVKMFGFDNETETKNSVVSKFIRTFYEDMRSFEAKLLEEPQSSTSSEKLPFLLRLEALLRKNCTNWIFDYQSQFRGILIFTHRKIYTFTLVVTFDEVDQLRHEIDVKSIQLENGYVPKKNWKPIDFVLEFELKLNLPFNMQWLCKGSSASDILQMLQEIDRICLESLKKANNLQLVCFSNQASILSYTGGGGTYVRKLFRQIVNRPNTDFKYVKKTEIQVELLNLDKLSFKDITFPQLHNFREEVHLLPTGLQFLQEFLPNALDYLKDS